MAKTTQVAPTPDPPTERFLTVKAVADRYAVHVASVWGWARDDHEFPKPVRLSGRCTRWRLSDLLNWEEKRGVVT